MMILPTELQINAMEFILNIGDQNPLKGGEELKS